MMAQQQRYSETPAENQEDIHVMCKALKIHRRVWGGDDARAAQFYEHLQQMQPALARSDEPGVRPAIPGVGPPPVSKEDFEEPFEKYQACFDRICERLKLPGLRRATSKREDTVCIHIFVCVRVCLCACVCICTCVYAARMSLTD
jgi:hypothetical protein